MHTINKQLGYLFIHTNNTPDRQLCSVGMLLDDGNSVATMDGVENVCDFIKQNIKQ